MKRQCAILEVIFALSLTVSAITFAGALDPTNSTVVKTPANATVFLENGTNISQPRTPLLMPSGNTTVDNLTDTNITGR
jgi:hypothetical protein